MRPPRLHLRTTPADLRRLAKLLQQQQARQQRARAAPAPAPPPAEQPTAAPTEKE